MTSSQKSQINLKPKKDGTQTNLTRNSATLGADHHHAVTRVYKCQICGKSAPPRTPILRLVTLTRPREYPPRPKVNAYVKDKRVIRTNDPGGVGTEIVREIAICPECLRARPT